MRNRSAVPPMTLVLETPRLALREMTPDDLDFLAEVLADPEVMRFYPGCCSRAESLTWIARQVDRYARHGHGFWLASDRATGEPVGQVGLVTHTIEGADAVGLGYIIHRPFWRRGYAAEASAGCLDRAFGVMGLSRVICLIRPVNLPSQGVARKLGMRPEPRLVDHAGFEHIVFTLAREEWPGGFVLP